MCSYVEGARKTMKNDALNKIIFSFFFGVVNLSSGQYNYRFPSPKSQQVKNLKEMTVLIRKAYD